jgi:UDP-N-acetylmuramoylalanine--D-glutamate ligase
LDYYDYFSIGWIIEFEAKMTNSNQITSLIPGALSLENSEIFPILVMGIGESGQAMAKWAHAQGAQVAMHDTREQSAVSSIVQAQLKELQDLGIKITYGKQADFSLQGIGMIAMSPGISPLDSWMVSLFNHAKENGIVIWGELDFFTHAINALKKRQSYQPKVVAITGTNGKTTTTALCGVIFRKTGKSVAVAGNISPSLLDKLTQCLVDQQLPDIWVLELSSYQLFYSQNFNPDAATVLNITEDHLDWHGDLNHYTAAKKKIFGPSTIPILNRDDLKVMSMIDPEAKDHVRTISFGIDTPQEPDQFGIVGDMNGGIDWLAWIMPDEETGQRKRRRAKEIAHEYEQPVQIKRLIPTEALRIKGRHNATNTLAALGLGQAIDLSMASLLHGLRDYRGEPHRVQSIAVIDDVEYIDDSKGTNVGATLAALTGLGASLGEKKIILIAGGDGKGQNFSPLSDAIHRFVKQVYLLGKDAQQIEAVLNANLVSIAQVATIEEAVNQASKIGRAGDKVLLSPACASLDMFKDYVHRAEVFGSAVENLSYQTHAIGVAL